MSDFNIPGVSSKYNTNQIVEDLMKLERIPMERMEDRVEELQDEKKLWQSVSRKLTSFRDAAKSLYGFENPFQERMASSSDESVLTATANREAIISDQRIEVVQTAKADRFLSKSLPRDFQVPEGTYTFNVGEREISFRFRGGELDQFVDILNTRGRDFLAGRIIRDTPDTQVLLIESKKTGAGNTLSFKGDAEAFGVSAGILEQRGAGSRTVVPQTAKPLQGSLPESKYSIENGNITIKPETNLALPVSPPMNPEENFVAEITINLRNLDRETYEAPQPPPGPAIPDTGSVSIEDITIESAPSKVPLPEWQPPEAPEVQDNLNVVYLQTDKGEKAFPALNNRDGSQTLRLSLEDVRSISQVNVRNRNTYRELEIQEIRFFNPDARGDYTPVNPVEQASDAVVKMDGITVTRPDNAIDDLIPGVTLNLERESTVPVNLSVEPNYDLVKDQLLNFVYEYDTLLSEILVLTTGEESVIDEMNYLSDEEREAALERLGSLRGNTTLTQLKSNLQRIVMNPYDTGEGSDISLLAEIGISTNAAGPSAGVNRTRLRGYLEVNEDTLDQKLRSNLSDIRALFGRDTDNDFVVDSGIGYALDNQVTPYITTGGIIPFRVTSLDTRIGNTEDDIANYEVKLENKEDELRRKYGMMEGMLENLQGSSQAIENFSNQNSGN